MYSAVFARTYPATDSAQVLAAAALDGYQGVQFNLQCAGIASLPEILPEGLPQTIAEQAKSLGLKIAALSGTYNMAHPDERARVKSRAGFLNVLKAASQMGTSIVTLCTGSRDVQNMWKAHPENTTAQAWSDLRAEMDIALEVAERYGIRLGIEPEPGNVICDAKAAERFLKEVNSKQLGIVLDAANLLSAELLPQQHAVMQEAIDLLGESLLLAHAKDINSQGLVVGAGDGAVDLNAFARLVRSTGYDGALVAHGFEANRSKTSAEVVNRLCRENP